MIRPFLNLLGLRASRAEQVERTVQVPEYKRTVARMDVKCASAGEAFSCEVQSTEGARLLAPGTYYLIVKTYENAEPSAQEQQ